MTRPRVILLCAVAALLAMPMFAVAGWPLTGSGSGYSKAHTLSGGTTPTASVSNRSVTVSWSAPGGSVPPSGYLVKRYNTSNQQQTILSNCSGTVTGTSCTENSVPGGTWRYSVTPVKDNWQGAESTQSTAVTVASATLTLSPRVLTSLPSTLSGTIANFIPGQTVTYRLDNPNSGTVLSGSISPTPVQSSGGATASATIPSGTSNGTHTIYAVGSSGDIASTTINVSVSSTDSTSDWSLRDASSGTETDASDPFAFANDSLVDTTGNWATAFSSTRFMRWNFNASLPSGTPSSVTFNFNYLPNAGGETTCIYFEVYRISTGSLIGTHGSSGSPLSCGTGTTYTTTSTTLSEVTSSAIANDLQIKVYARESNSKPIKIDLATVSVTMSSQSYTLYETTSTDASTGTATTTPWSLATANDGVYYQANSNWTTSFSSSRYLKFSLPGYVPTGATVDGGTFKHAYVQNGGGTTCFYYEVYNGTTLIGTHGSASSPYSCNASSSVYQTDTVSIPEVDTVTEANNVVVKAYGRNDGSHTSRSDVAQLDINYTTGAPRLVLPSTTITALPSTLNGSIASFASGQTVSFRLDNPDSGTALTGSISPDPVPANGTSSVSVTIPSGTTNGSHTVYAIGSLGDIASASVTVNRQTTITFSDWNLRDASSGTETDASDELSFGSDSRFDTTTNWSNAFSTSRYIDFIYDSPMKSSTAVSAATFNFSFSASQAGDQACFYFEVWKASTSTLLATHGSSAAPVACQTGTTFNTSATSLPEVTSGAIANDLAVVVYGRNTGSRPFRVDLATVSVTAASQSYSLYETLWQDAADGSAANFPWSLASSGDGVYYQPTNNWTSSFSTARYLKFSFPAYVPASGTVDSVSFSHSYVQSGGGTTCFYYEVFNGTTSLGTHGSSASPYSCNSSNSTYVTDTFSLPEVTTVTQANNIVVKAYARNSSSQSSRSDLVQLQLTYTSD